MFLSSGDYHTSVIDENEIIYSWGYNGDQLKIPLEYKTIKFISISSGRCHTLRRAQPWRADGQRASAIDETGIIYSWEVIIKINQIFHQIIKQLDLKYLMMK